MVPNFCLLQRHLEVKWHDLFWTSLEQGPSSLYQICCQCSKEVLRYDLTSFMVAWLTTLAVPVKRFRKSKKRDVFCEAWSEDDLCQIWWRLDNFIGEVEKTLYSFKMAATSIRLVPQVNMCQTRDLLRYHETKESLKTNKSTVIGQNTILPIVVPPRGHMTYGICLMKLLANFHNSFHTIIHHIPCFSLTYSHISSFQFNIVLLDHSFLHSFIHTVG